MLNDKNVQEYLPIHKTRLLRKLYLNQLFFVRKIFCNRNPK